MNHVLKVSLKLATVIALVAAISVAGRSFGELIPEFEGWVDHIGFWGPIVFTMLFILLTGLQLPESVLAVAAGVAFGLVEGFLLVVLVNFMGAVVWFWTARWFLRGYVSRFLSRHPKLSAIEKATANEGFKLMVLLRLGPFSYGFLNLLPCERFEIQTLSAVVDRGGTRQFRNRLLRQHGSPCREASGSCRQSLRCPFCNHGIRIPCHTRGRAHRGPCRAACPQGL